MEEYDVIVVGAGPAGSIAAKTLAENGASVLVIERKQEIGPPKRCAEGLTDKTLNKLGIPPHPAWAPNKIYGAYIYSPKGTKIELRLEGETGYVLERKIFEKYLAAKAINAGAKYMIKTLAESVILENGQVVGVNLDSMGEKKSVSCKILIAADGVDSKIARSAGINTTNNPADYHAGFQYELAGVTCKDDVLHFFFGDNVAQKGYAWIFPKGNTLANVGLGILSKNSRDGSRAKDCLDGFIESHPQFFKDSCPVEINAGGIPVSGGLKNLVGDGILIVGDAAQHVHPVTGGGMTFAMMGAKLAAQTALEAIEKKDYSKKTLSSYEDAWEKEFGDKMRKLLRARKLLEKLSEDEMEKISTIFTGEELLRITRGEMSSVMPLIMKKAPKMAFLLRKLMD